MLLQETIELLKVRPRGRYVDCTLGPAGHAAAILEASQPGGLLLGMDADEEAIEIAREKLSPYGEAALIVDANFRNLLDTCRKHGFNSVDGVFFDLGMSSAQLENRERGFSFRFDAPLDMRFGTDQQVTAADILNHYSESEIAGIIREYGEERRSRQIARRIVAHRPIHTTDQLVDIVESLAGRNRPGKIHPATRTFQALRIAVNEEMSSLKEALQQAIVLLKPEGRLVVISYHSLEDRIVKQFMLRESRDCLCPPEAPVCHCEHNAKLRVITKKAVVPGENEVRANPRSRSAKMRGAERLP